MEQKSEITEKCAICNIKDSKDCYNFKYIHISQLIKSFNIPTTKKYIIEEIRKQNID
jgi:hypothetical protein